MPHLTIDIDPDAWLDDRDHRGRRHSLILLAEPRRLEVFTAHDASSLPEPVWHRRGVAWSLPPCRGRELVSWLRERESAFTALLACYLGAESMSGDRIGCWSDDATELADAIRESLAAATFPRRWDAGDYLGADRANVIAEVRAALDAGKTSAEVVAALVQEAEPDAMLDPADVDAVITAWLEDEPAPCQCGRVRVALTGAGEACTLPIEPGTAGDPVEVAYVSLADQGRLGGYPGDPRHPGSAWQRATLRADHADELIAASEWVVEADR